MVTLLNRAFRVILIERLRFEEKSESYKLCIQCRDSIANKELETAEAEGTPRKLDESVFYF